MKMTTEEAFVKVLQMRGIEQAFPGLTEGGGFRACPGLHRAISTMASTSTEKLRGRR